MIIKPPVKEAGDDQRPIIAALGYFQLSMYDEALDEIEGVSLELKRSHEVLSLRGEIYFAKESWLPLMEVSLILVRGWPEVGQYWIWLGHTTRMLHWYSESKSVLTQALELHPFEPMLYFSLACTEAQHGDMIAAKSRLISALALDHDICFLAMADPDLQPLWADLDEGRLRPESNDG